MDITTQFHGILADWVGTSSARFQFSDNATYGDLMRAIGTRYRQNMPEQLWDTGKNTFQKQVRAMGEGRALDAPDDPLVEGENITFLLMIAGG